MKVELRRGQSIDLDVVRLPDIVPHEDTIPSFLSSVTQDMLRTGFQRDPILVDRNSMVALDGMHRRAALSRLQAKYALCAFYDYSDSEIKLERWLRYFIAPERKLIERLKSLFDLKEVSSFRRAMRAVDSGESSIALLSRRESYVSETADDLMTSYHKLSLFDDFAKRETMEVQFHPESERSHLFTSESVFVIYPMRLEKESVLRVAEAGGVLPFKTTRHIMPVRPMGVFFPLNLLMQSSRGKCIRELRRILASSKPALIARGSWYEGRRYSEPIVIFERDRETE